MKSLLHTTLAIAAIAGFALTANAGSIGVNTGPVGQEINGQAAGAEVVQTVWNDKMQGAGFGTSTVVDDSGTLLATTVSVNTSWANTTGTGTSDGDHSLLNGTMDNGGGAQGFTITGIPYATYDVYIYHEGGNDAGRGGSFQVWDSDNGDAVLATQDSYDTSTFNGTWVEASTVGTGGTGIDDNGTPGDPSDDFAVNSNYIKFTGLSAPNIKIRSIANTLGNPSVPRAPMPAFQIVEGAADADAPTPDPMTFASLPAAAGDSQITMTATTATDPSGVEYYFTETSGNPGGADSGWQDSETYVDTGLNPGTTYSYTVMARDKSPAQNATAASAGASATTDAPDTTAPTPSPMTFASVPAADSDTEISMTATTATDPAGVEYYFTETSGNPGGDDSGWQDSTSYTDTGLDPSTTYTYTVKARDKSAGQNETLDSSAESATTDALPTPGTMIGVNTGPVGQEINGQLAGAEVQQSVWNDKMQGAGFGTSAVVDDQGFLLATTVSVQTQWAATTGSGTSDGDHSLLNGTMDNNGGPQGFTITGIPYANYDVYIYHEGGSNVGRGGSFQVWDSDNGDAVLATQDSYDTSTFNGTWVEASTVGTGGTGIDDNGTPGDPSDDFAVNSNYIKFTGLSAPNIKIRSIANTLGNPATPRAPMPAFQIVEGAADADAPTPDPMTFASLPAAAGDSQITMTATTATDPNGVEYYFTETSGNPGGADSGWQDSETYVDTGLNPGTTYSYTVKARDKSPGQNETAASAAESATTDAPDTTAPTPSPMTFASVPTADSDTEISMTATTATDPAGVEYYFTETSGNPGGDDSGWQDSTSYTDTGLDPSTTYTYTVKARDKSAGQNETADSSAESATTDALPTPGTMIGVNTGPVGQEINGQLAGAEVQQSVWNDKMQGAGFGTSAVVDDQGFLLATTVSVNTSWANTTGSGTSDGDHSLLNGTMDNGGGPQGFTITGIPYATYDVYIYHEGGNDAGRGGSFQVWDSDNGDAVLATQDSYDTSTFNGTWVEASTVGTGGTGIDDNGTPGDPSDDFAVNSNYIKFTGLSAPNIKIRSIANTLGNPSVPRAPMPGFQIVESSAGGSAYDDWAAANGLTGGAGSATDPAVDADGDKGGKTNLYEFGFNGDPLDPTNEGLLYSLIADSDADGDTDPELLFTIAVRVGTVFTGGSPATSAAVDGIIYTVGGDIDLDGFDDDTPVSVATTAVVPAGAPDLTDTGYEYVTLSLDGSTGTLPVGFLRASVAEAP